MKDKLKNTLEHEVELLGRSVSVLAIAGLLVVGGASAALLDSFGTVTGDADVDQAVYLEDSDADTIEEGVLTASYDGEAVAGESYFDSYDVINDGEIDAEAAFSNSVEDEADNEVTEGVRSNYFLAHTFKFEENVSSESEDVEFRSELVEDNDRPAVYLSTSFDTLAEGHAVTSGFAFPVEIESDWRNDEIEVDYREGEDHEAGDSPDWIFYTVELEEEVDYGEGAASEFKVWTVNADEDDVGREDGGNYVVEFEEVDQFISDAETEELTGLDLDSIEEGTVTSVSIATGTAGPEASPGGSQTESDLYIYDVVASGESPTFNQDDEYETLIISDEGLDAELGARTELDIALEPDVYTVETHFDVAEN